MKDLINILLIDDDEEDFLITKNVFSEIQDKEYSLEWVSTYEKGIATVMLQQHDVYLVDFRLGIKTGLELTREAITSGCEKPIILLTGQGTPEIDRQAMEAGAYDFIEKSNLNPLLLERTIRYSMRHANDIHEIRRLNTELEKRVKERTLALAGVIRELQESNQSLVRVKEDVSRSLAKEKELNELKSRFVSTASHEFRTPLATILTSANLIAKYNNDQDGHEEKRLKHIHRINTAVNNLQEILSDFLSLGKLEEGKIRNNPVLFDMVEFSMNLAEELQEISKNNQKINYRHLGDRHMVFLDQQLLRNTLVNIISNSIKYSQEGKNITFTTKCTDKKMIASVKDEGIGIPEDEQPLIFERFFRARNSTDEQGTGLGLNIARKYTQLMNGAISFASKPDIGTTFIVEVPI